MKTLTLEKKDILTITLKELRPLPIKSDDSFFSSVPIDIGHTNNVLIDKILYGSKCPK